jgi:hypothetical protein
MVIGGTEKPDGIVAIFTVTMATGAVKVHRWKLTPDEKSLTNWSNLITAQLTNAYVKGSTKGFMLLGPSTIYSAQHVASVSLEIMASSELEELVARMNLPNKMGFI